MVNRPLIVKMREEVNLSRYVPDWLGPVDWRDLFEECLSELFFIDHPQYRRSDGVVNALAQYTYAKEYADRDVWVYYPWLHKAFRIVDEELFFKLRTARNRNLVTAGEQEKYRACRVGIAGLSVGSSILTGLVLAGGPKYLKLADPDIIEFSNLNRLTSGGIPTVGKNKSEVAAYRVWELDPFADITVLTEGLTHQNIDEFVSNPKLDVFIDEMDNLELKFVSRFYCRKYGMPVLMATDNGDTVMLDVERFDLEPNRAIFHGLVREIDISCIPDKAHWLEVATKIIGLNDMTPELRQSFEELGKTLSGVPQLGTTAMAAGAITALAVRLLANGAKLQSGRYTFNLKGRLIPDDWSG